MGGGLIFLGAAFMAAILYLMPYVFPFFAPGKRAVANHTGFLG